MFYKNMESLKPVVEVVNEAAHALGDPERTIQDAPLIDALAAAIGAAGGGGAAFLTLYGMGTVGLSAVGITTGLAATGALVGGGMVAGVLALSALPVAGVAVTGKVVAGNIKKKKLRETKKEIYIQGKDILERINEELDKAKKAEDCLEERITLLIYLSIALTKIIDELTDDLIS